MELNLQSIFTKYQSLKLAGANFGARMTVIRLKSGQTWIHSPIELTDEIKKEVLNFGEPLYLVSPNPFHHLYLKKWKDAFPNAKTAGFSSIEKKTNLHLDLNLESSAFAWEDEIKTKIIQGSNFYQESIHYHMETQSLLLTDLIFNFTHQTPDQSFMSRMILKMYGTFGKPKSSFLMKMILKNKKEVRQILDELNSFEINRVIPCHGDLLEKDAKDQFQKCTAWIQ